MRSETEEQRLSRLRERLVEARQRVAETSPLTPPWHTREVARLEAELREATSQLEQSPPEGA